MKKNLTNLEQFVSLQPEFSEKATILQYIKDMKIELVEIWTKEFELPDGTKRCLNIIPIGEVLGVPQK